MSETQTQTKRDPKKALIAVAVAVGVLLIAVIAVLVMLLLKKEPAAPAVAEPGTGNVVVDDGFDPNAMQKAADDMFEVKMSTSWVFPDGASPSTDAYVANSGANSLPFYFEILLPESGEDGGDEVLYKSPVLPVGSAVREITLNRDLDAGQYEGMCVYYNLNPDNTIESTIPIVVRLTVNA